MYPVDLVTIGLFILVLVLIASVVGVYSGVKKLNGTLKRIENEYYRRQRTN